MKNRQFYRWGLALIGVLLLSNCQQVVQPPSPVLVTGITLSANTGSLGVGGALQLSASLTPATATDKSVTWSSSSESTATVSETGLVTGLAGGIAVITATSVSDNTRSATCTVTVVSLAAKKAELTTATTAATLLLQTTGVGTFVGMVSGSVSSAYSDAIGLALAVKGDSTSTFGQVEAAIADLATATTTFTDAKITALGASKASLDSAIAAATTLKTATQTGTAVGQVDASAVSPYATAIAAATTVSTQASATVTQLDAARTTLATATATFRNAIVVPDNLYVYINDPAGLTGTSAALSGVTAPSAFAGATLTPDTSAGNASEGNNSLALTLSADGQGFSFVAAENDLTRYSKLRFSLKVASGTLLNWIKLSMKMVGFGSTLSLSNLSVVTDGTYHEVVVPLSSFTGLNLAVVNVPFEIMASGGTPAFTAQIDKVYFSKN